MLLIDVAVLAVIVASASVSTMTQQSFLGCLNSANQTMAPCWIWTASAHTGMQVFHTMRLGLGLPFHAYLRRKMGAQRGGPESERKVTGLALLPITVNPLQANG